ncbi:MAG: formate dehydrogenase, partial [Chloroflexota bacterium]|nr:formate dehydrogenase [Chloroflexota bacterium]
MKTIIPVENNDTLASVRGFLKQLLEAEVVDALLVPMETPTGAITPALVSDPDLLDVANPLAPVMGLNAARIASRVSIRKPRGRIGVVLRPCELRALVELVKLKQASMDDLVTIGVDCLGTYDVPAHNGMRTNGTVDMAALLATAQSGDLAPQEGYTFRDACQMCDKPHVEEADIVLELYGADLNAGIPIGLPDDIGARLALAPAGEDERRAGVVEKVVTARTQVRDERFAEMRQRLEQEGVERVLAACVRCHNCMTVCPICYCKTCLFKSPTFD